MRATVLLLLLLAASLSQAQNRELWRGNLGLPRDSQIAAHYEVGYALPEVHRWYTPSHLEDLYSRPWYRADTRYDRIAYTRYVNALLEGYDFYDLLGSPLGRGWLVYSWTQQQPGARGDEIIKTPVRTPRGDARNTAFDFSAYNAFFNRLVIAADKKGGGVYRLMVGDQIATTFTPLTFSKPNFNGVRLDWATDWYRSTLLLARPSQPNRVSFTNSTHLSGGHAEFQAGRAGQLGFSYVNVRNANTQRPLNHGNPLAGTLTADQNQALRRLWVRLRDDSPADRRGGAALLEHEIVLVDTSGREWRGSEVGLVPTITGGFDRGNALVADGGDFIQLEYDLQNFSHEDLNTRALSRVGVELKVADDYRVEMASNLQTDGQAQQAAVVFLPVSRAAGNVQDRSNTRILSLDYGLPVANEVLGMDWNLAEWKGLSIQGELALHRLGLSYPNPIRTRHHRFTRQAPALYAQLNYRRLPWRLFGEGFSIADGYSTSFWITEANGVIKYRSPIPSVFEMVDDDDDQNGVPEWRRLVAGESAGVTEETPAWPGYDENQDFLNDYNQNNNLIPDYEEPFLRFRADRPAFLFGMDMNHNGTIDRFENDELPDYPYKKDHRGYNLYGQVEVLPGFDLFAGHQRQGLISGDGHTRAWYGMGLWSQQSPRGRLRLIAHGARVRDNIPDDLVLWVQPVDAQGRMRAMPDLLPAQDAWTHTLYADWEQGLAGGLRLQHRFKWEFLRQLDSDASLELREGRRNAGFLGLIDKAEWSIPLGLGILEPRWKSEWQQVRPFSARQQAFTSLEQLGILLWTQPLLAEKTKVGYFGRYGRQLFDTQLQVGVEGDWFWLVEGRREDLGEDFFRWTWITQLTNRVAYQGYQVVTRAGLRLSSWDFARSPGQQSSLFFLTLNAGLR
jgi:hypothetical protein